MPRPQALEPDICITAAYGNILPEAFLSIPKRGTVNVHPSLLPAYRGAAPVQRALEAGETVSGVTVAFTVRAMARPPPARMPSSLKAALPVFHLQSPCTFKFTHGTPTLCMGPTGRAASGRRPRDRR